MVVCGLHDFPIILFSFSETMLIAMTKVLIVDTLHKQQSMTTTTPQPPTVHIPHRSGRSVLVRSPSFKHFSMALPWDDKTSYPSVPSESRLPTTLPWDKKDMWMTTLPGAKAFPFSSIKDGRLSISGDESYLPSFVGTGIKSHLIKRSERAATSVSAPGTAEASQIRNVYSHRPATRSGLHRNEEDASAQNFSVRTTSLITRGVTVQDKMGEDGDDDVNEKVSWYLILDHVCIYVTWIILGPFCGAWSDRHGRKLLMLLPCVLHVLAVLVYQLVSLWPDQLVTAVCLAGVLRGACGQHTMFTTAMFSSMSDVLPEEQKSTRFASISGWCYVAGCGGHFGAGILLEYFPLSCPLLLTSFVQAFCFFVVLICVTDTLSSPPPSGLDDQTTSVFSTLRMFIRKLRKPENMERTPLIKRGKENGAISSGSLSSEEEHRSAWRVVVILALSFGMQSLWGSQREICVQVVSQPPFEWPNSWYGYLYAVDFGTGGTATILLVPLLVRLVHGGSHADIYVLVIGLLCGAGGCVWTALAVMFHSNWQVFVSSSVMSVGLAANATYRAMLSKEVAPSAQATAQAVLSVVENMAKVLGILLHTTIFVATFSSLSPSFVYFLMTGEAFLLLGLVRWLVKSRRGDYVVL